MKFNLLIFMGLISILSIRKTLASSPEDTSEGVSPAPVIRQPDGLTGIDLLPFLNALQNPPLNRTSVAPEQESANNAKWDSFERTLKETFKSGAKLVVKSPCKIKTYEQSAAETKDSGGFGMYTYRISCFPEFERAGISFRFGFKGMKEQDDSYYGKLTYPKMGHTSPKIAAQMRQNGEFEGEIEFVQSKKFSCCEFEVREGNSLSLTIFTRVVKLEK
jgi:hypothetical protein